MKQGTRVVIDGIPYVIVEIMPTITYGRHVLIVEHDCSGSSNVRASIDQILKEISNGDVDQKTISAKIVAWFADQRIKSGGNMKPMLALKTKPSVAEAQIRRLLKQGEEPETILEVLAYAIQSKFWISVIETRMHRIATLTEGEVATNYDKIKTEMSRERNTDVVEFVAENEPVQLLGRRSVI